MSSMLSEKTPWDTVATGYAEITMNFFRVFSNAALALAGVNKKHEIIDVACGPGTLSLEAASLVQSVHALDFSEPMIKILDKTILEQNIANIKTHCGDGQQLPYEHETFNAGFSLFGLMFFPDRTKGYTELLRVLKPGGKAVISSWAPVMESTGFQVMFGALREINPDIPEPQSDIASLENPDFFVSEMTQAGFRDVEIHRVTGDIPFTNLEQFWDEMTRGTAPILMYKKTLTDAEWEEKTQIALSFLRKKQEEMPDMLQTHAWLAMGTK